MNLAAEKINLEEKIDQDIDKGVDCNNLLATKVFKYYSPLLRTYFYNRLRKWDEVDDYLQELYCRILVYKHPGKIKSIQKFIFTIAVNLMRDRSRRVTTRINKQSISLEDLDEISDNITSQFAQCDRPQNNIYNFEKIKKIQIVLNELPIKCGRAFWLNKIEGFKQDEIAIMLGVTVSAVEKYMMLAKKKIEEKADNSSYE